MAYIPSVPAVISTGNSSTTPLAAGATFTGTWEEVTQYGSVIVGCATDAGISGTVTVQFSQDGSTTTGTAGPWAFSASGSIGVPKGLVPTARYMRVVVANTSGSPQTTLKLQTLYHPGAKIAIPTSRISQTLNDETDVINVRSALVGLNDAGDFVAVPVTSEGHMEVEVHGPRTAFGEIRTASITPRVQASFPYGINTEQFDTWASAGGTVAAAAGQVTVSIDATANAWARISTRRRLHYRPGQGALARYTAVMSAGAASSIMIVGPITEESGWAFGRNGTSYGVLHRKGGQRNIRTLSFSAGAGGAENVTITLDGTAKVVAVTAGSATNVAYQLSMADYSSTGDGWDAAQVGATVVFLARRAKVTSGAFTLSSTGSTAGTFANTTAGVAPTDTWVAQADWDDPMTAGNGSTGITLDPTKGQVYENGYQYLGYGPATYSVEYQPVGGNNPTWCHVYILPYLNARTTPSVKVPSAPWTMEVRSLGSTTALSMSSASVLLGVEGTDTAGIGVPPIVGSSSSVGTTEIPLFTIRNGLTWGGTQTNQTGKRITTLTIGVRGATNAITTVRIRRGATLTGTPNFGAINTSVTAAYLDTAATGVSGGTLLWQAVFTETAMNSFDVREQPQLYMEPGDAFTISAQASTGSSTIVSVTVESVEFQ